MKRILRSVSRILRRVMPACEEATRIASDRLDDGVPLVRRIRLITHLVICVWCRRYVRQIALLRHSMRRYDVAAGAGMTPLPAEARERIKTTLRADPDYPRSVEK
jgi:hypothetical protein